MDVDVSVRRCFDGGECDFRATECLWLLTLHAEWRTLNQIMVAKVLFPGNCVAKRWDRFADASLCVETGGLRKVGPFWLYVMACAAVAPAVWAVCYDYPCGFPAGHRAPPQEAFW